MNSTHPTSRQRCEERQRSFSRRRFLRGVCGASLALPWLPSLFPASASAAAADSARPPVRMAFFMVPNGVVQKNWWPTGGERDFQLGKTMEVLAPYKQHLQVISGLYH